MNKTMGLCIAGVGMLASTVGMGAAELSSNRAGEAGKPKVCESVDELIDPYITCELPNEFGKKKDAGRTPTSSLVQLTTMAPVYCPTEDSCKWDYRQGQLHVYSGRGRIWYPVTRKGWKECSYFEGTSIHQKRVWNYCNVVAAKPPRLAPGTTTVVTPRGTELIEECIEGYNNRSERNMCVMGW